ncbi:MAG: WYL domain-containing protein [Bacteroidales bacterium]|nr:WYL domain-containing protein [Bacteroidales bacterium]
MVSELLKKYIWLTQTILRKGREGVTFAQLSGLWKERWGEKYPRRSFNNHREAIAEIFGVQIDCDRSTNCYLIKDSGDMSNSDTSTSWMINTFTVNSLLTLAQDRLKGRVSVDDIPSGRQYLASIMEAMQDNLIVEIQYLKYNSSEPAAYTIHPYAVKESDKRWYLVGWCEQRKQVRVYGLDRIFSLTVCDARFKMPDEFDVDELFASCYGVYLPDNDQRPVNVVFKASAAEAKYLKDLPLHPSQTLQSEDKWSATFSMFVNVNNKLVMDLLSRGPRIEVISPVSLRNTIKEEIKKTSQLYE